jgi:hypothetical protein
MKHPQYPNYEITEDGKVYSLYYKKHIEGVVSRDGYRTFTLLDVNKKRKSVFLHRLLGELFIPNPHNHPNILHWDDNKSNNSLENLRWGTQEENVDDMRRNGNLQIPDNSKSWRVLSPEGVFLTTGNLSQFCRDNGLDKRLLHKTLPSGDRKTHKGFSLLGMI